MVVCYNKLWKLLIDRGMNKTELRTAAGISTGALAKLGKNENVNTEILVKICKVLDCGIADIMDITPTENQNTKLKTIEYAHQGADFNRIYENAYEYLIEEKAVCLEEAKEYDTLSISVSGDYLLEVIGDGKKIPSEEAE